ncbi:MAG: hypothetical protein HQM09_21335, partial [Candidatus Riflebacteria bacterium]|nr:hypothetical protein [Candidatus Riflebacteria bacterium]
WAAALVGRASGIWTYPTLNTFLIGFFPAALLSFFRMSKQMPDYETLTALFDRCNEYGGLLMSSDIQGSEAWPLRKEQLAIPDLRWRIPMRLALLPILGGIFALAAVSVPTAAIVPPAVGALKIDEEVKRLSAEIETLKQEELVPASQAEKLQERLEGLRAAGSGDDPARTWEALDHLEQAAARSAREGAEETIANAEKLANAQKALEEALSSGASSTFMPPENMADLSKMLERASATIPVGRGGSSGLEDAMASMSRDAAASLASSLGSLSSAALARLERLDKAVKLDPATLAKMKTLKQVSLAEGSFMTCTGTCTSTSSMTVLIPGQSGNKDASGAILISMDTPGDKDSPPGSGGVSRGRADAKMHFGDATSEENARFQEQTLPPNEGVRLEETQTIGVAMTAPQAATRNVPSTGGLLSTGNPSANSSAITRTLLPRHRPAVKRFFQHQ